ncbi:L,D-transpeptidase family protein [Candidatus Nomurabacteria bacterium]|nr:L,D-transpeptidase family protein [Candidatus Nomurabacteria bacterium]
MAKSEKVIYALLALLIVLVIVLVTVIFYAFWSPAGPVQTDMSDVMIVDLEHLEAPPSPFLADEEMVVVTSSTTDELVLLPVEKVLFEFIEIVDSCGAHFEGECLRVRSGPGTDYPVLESLRNGVVLKVGGQVERDGRTWYKIIFDEWLRYPERVKGDWYVAAEFVRVLLDEGERTVWEHEYSTTSKKSITVDRSEQRLYAFEGNEIFLEADISTGLELTPTPRGTFTIYKKTPSRYMQGPLPNLADRQYYDLPGVPWNLYFTEGGAVIHGAYWHNSFGSQYSHGCVNLPPSIAHVLYTWAELGTTVIVQD